ncbi:MAG: hypothetical protein HQ530_01055 [Parcubacteria group bacterium]|nr:hypothetical protein [Parcubacteria group bacterium]
MSEATFEAVPNQDFPEGVVREKGSEIRRDLEAITGAYTTNVTDEKHGRRTMSQAELNAQRPNLSRQEASYAEALEMRMGLEHRDWAAGGFKMHNSSEGEGSTEVPQYSSSRELGAQQKICSRSRSEVDESSRVAELEKLVTEAFPEFEMVRYSWEGRD